MNSKKQSWLPFWSVETKEERCQRILSGKLGAKLRRASELAAAKEGASEVDLYFDYDAATAIVRDTGQLEKVLLADPEKAAVIPSPE